MDFGERPFEYTFNFRALWNAPDFVLTADFTRGGTRTSIEPSGSYILISSQRSCTHKIRMHNNEIISNARWSYHTPQRLQNIIAVRSRRVGAPHDDVRNTFSLSHTPYDTRRDLPKSDDHNGLAQTSLTADVYRNPGTSDKYIICIRPATAYSDIVLLCTPHTTRHCNLYF